MTPEKNVANPGSTLGEAVGALIEAEVNRLLRPIAEDNGCVYLSAGRPDPRSGHDTKLLLKDTAGNEYHIDAVIANERMQPLVLIESKYIRYKKHNRDKASWVCTAHYSLRRTFPSVRKSITVLAGRWSGPSKELMKSFDVNLFEVNFQHIVDTLREYQINFDWGEKERDKAMSAWRIWEKLKDEDYQEIGRRLLSDIEPQLRESLTLTLNTSIPREIEQIQLSVETNLGEIRLYTFGSIEDVLEFLETFDVEEAMSDESGPSLWVVESSDTSQLSLFDEQEEEDE